MSEQRVGIAGFPARVKARRVELGLTQEALGAQLGVTGVAVWKWENGAAEPTVRNAWRLAEALDVELTDLVLGPVEAA